MVRKGACMCISVCLVSNCNTKCWHHKGAAECPLKILTTVYSVKLHLFYQPVFPRIPFWWWLKARSSADPFWCPWYPVLSLHWPTLLNTRKRFGMLPFSYICLYVRCIMLQMVNCCIFIKVLFESCMESTSLLECDQFHNWLVCEAPSLVCLSCLMWRTAGQCHHPGKLHRVGLAAHEQTLAAHHSTSNHHWKVLLYESFIIWTALLSVRYWLHNKIFVLCFPSRYLPNIPLTIRNYNP